MAEEKQAKETPQAQQKRILECMADVLKDNGFRAEVVDSTGASPTLLRVETQRNGKVMQEVMIEMCFIPIQLPEESTALLQFYATLFHGLPEETADETKKTCDYVNDFSALGHFGYFKPAGQLYLRHNTLLRMDDALEKTIGFMADNLSLIIAGVGRFIDAFAMVSNGVLKLDAAIEQEVLPKL